MHRHHPPESFQLIILPGRFERDDHPDPTQSVAHRIMDIARDRAFAD